MMTIMNPSRSLPRFSTSTTFIVLLIITIFAVTAKSQDANNLIPTSGSDDFPACAVDCPLLKQAQSSCLAAPGSNRDTHVSCFCQSALLTTLHSTPQGICDSSCSSADDLQTLQKWYSSFCASGGTDSGGTTTTSSGSSPTGDSSSSGSSGRPAGPGHQSWIDGHWQWVVMVVVLIVGFTALAVGGVYLKRRYHRKHDPIPTGSGMLPPPTNRSSSAMQQTDSWGPQTVHPRGAEFVGGNPSASDTYLPHRSVTSTPDVTNMVGRDTPNGGNNRFTRGRGLV